MILTPIAAMVSQPRVRPESGIAVIAYRVTADGHESGLAHYRYEWDKRDVLTELLTAEPHIADAIREEYPDMEDDGGPMCFSPFCDMGGEMRNKGDIADLLRAEIAATEVIYDAP